jgi:hypothetical protein
MKYLDFEKHIKNELNGSKDVVQMDTLLASLNLGKKQPKRKGFAFWMILPFLLLTISFITWQTIGFNNNIESDPQLTKESSKVQPTEKEIFTSENENKEINNSIASQDNSENFNEEVLTSSFAQRQTLDNNPLNSTSKNTINSINKPIETDNFRSFYEKDKLNNEPLGEPLKVSSLNTSYIYKQDSEGSTLNTISEDKIISSVEVEAKSSRGLLSIADLDNSLVSINENNIDGNLFSRMKINCPSFDNLGWHMALIPEVGLFYPIKTLENNSPEVSEAFNERFSSETTLEGLELGLYGMLVRDNVPLYLKAGVSYSRISERMNLKYEYTEQDTTIGIISSTISANGDTITHIYGEIITETTFKGSNRQHHYIHLFDIPISIGFTTYLAGLDIGIEAGVKVNFMTRATGNLLTSRNEYTNLALNKLFKKNIGISYFGGLMIGRNFGRFGDIYIAPRFNYFPNSFNNQNNNISQKYFNIGLNAGVVYKIN